MSDGTPAYQPVQNPSQPGYPLVSDDIEKQILDTLSPEQRANVEAMRQEYRTRREDRDE